MKTVNTLIQKINCSETGAFLLQSIGIGEMLPDLTEKVKKERNQTLHSQPYCVIV